MFAFIVNPIRAGKSPNICHYHKSLSSTRHHEGKIWGLIIHLPRVTKICVGELGQPWFRLWLVASPAPSHYLNQCWLIVSWNLRNKLQWNLKRKTKRFIHENAFENVVCEMAVILSRGDELIFVSWIFHQYLNLAAFMLYGIYSCIGQHDILYGIEMYEWMKDWSITEMLVYPSVP